MNTRVIVEAFKNCRIHGTLDDVYKAGRILAIEGINTTIHEDDIAGYWIELSKDEPIKKTFDPTNVDCPF